MFRVSYRVGVGRRYPFRGRELVLLIGMLGVFGCYDGPDIGIPFILDGGAVNFEAGAPGGNCTPNDAACSVQSNMSLAGGELLLATGGGVSVPSGAFPEPTEVGIAFAELSNSDITGLPASFGLVGGIVLTLGASPTVPLELFVPAPAESAGTSYLLAQTIEQAGERHLSVVDTASISGNRLVSNCPPFPGVVSAGTYLFLAVPQGTSIAMFSVLDTAQHPVAGIQVEILNGVHAFLGISAGDGFTSIPVPPNVKAQGAIAIGISPPGPNDITPSLLGDIVATEIGLLPLPIPQPIPDFSSLLVTLVVQDLGISLDDLPEIPGCLPDLVAANPSAIPMPGELPFQVGQGRQLTVACGTNPDCTKTSGFTDMLLMALKGYSINFTTYTAEGDAQSSAPVTVTNDGIVLGTAVGTGQILVGVQKVCFQKQESLGVPVPIVSFAPEQTTAVSPVVVSCASGQALTAAQQCATLVGEYDIYYRYNAGGCFAGGNPYSCITVPPGPIHIDAAPGLYRVEAVEVYEGDTGGGGGMVVWSGDDTSGTEYYPAGQSVEFEHESGQITLYYNDWYAGDNDPGAWTLTRVFQLVESIDAGSP